VISDLYRMAAGGYLPEFAGGTYLPNRPRSERGRLFLGRLTSERISRNYVYTDNDRGFVIRKIWTTGPARSKRNPGSLVSNRYGTRGLQDVLPSRYTSRG
jgi:hypothetical protein